VDIYRKEVSKASNEAWRTLCNSVNDLPISARLQRALSRDPKIKLEYLVALLGMRTKSKGENLELLLATHFHNLWLLRGWWPLMLPTAPNNAIGRWLQKLPP